MSVTVEQFVKTIGDSGLLSADELQTFQASLPAARRPADATALARELVAAGKLTKYQASAAYQGKAKGLILGQYVVLDRIGAGGMGQVFKAQHRRMKRIVAIKVLPVAAAKNPELVKRFSREVEAVARLSHPNIVVAHDADEANGTLFLVMEYVDGHDLNALDKQGRTLSVEEALDYVVQAARGLAYAHSQGVVHRDIKPANLLLDKSGTVKILDMGLARFEAELGSSDGLTRSGEIMGTVDYMAPEQAEDTRKADHRSDIYSLGCTLHKLLTGLPVYGGESIMSKMLAHRDQAVPALCDKRGDVPLELDAVFQRMVAKQPADRFASMQEALTALESCRALAGASVRHGANAVPSPPFDSSPHDMFAGLTTFEPARPTTRSEGGATLISNQPLPVSGAAPQMLGPVARPPSLPRSRGKQHNQQLMLWLGIGGGAAALMVVLGVVLVLAFGMGGKPGKPDDKKVAKRPEKPEKPEKTSGKPDSKPATGVGSNPLVPLLGSGKSPQSDPTAADGPYDFLFSGADLAGWQQVGGGAPNWKVSGGVLTSPAGAKSGPIFCTKEFSDFVLDLEFRVSSGGNGGIYVRAPLQEDASRTGLEIQLLDDTAPQYASLKADQYCGSIYRLVAASPRASRKPNEWQNMQIICAKERVKVRLNGALVVDADLNKHADKIATNPGISRRSGYIGLQPSADPIDFRKIKLRLVRPGDL